MNVKEWKASKEREIALPSGLTIKVRTLNVFDLMDCGPIPGIEEMNPTGTEGQRRVDSAKTMFAYLAKAIISPKVGEGEDELDLRYLSNEDLERIYEAVAEPAPGPREVPGGAPLDGTASPEA